MSDTTTEYADLDNTIAVIAKAMEISGTETVTGLAAYCKTRATSPRKLIEDAQRASDQVAANDHRMSLLLSGTDLVVQVRPWDRQHDCIALVFDGLNDHRTPALTPEEARELAYELEKAAESIDGEHEKFMTEWMAGRGHQPSSEPIAGCHECGHPADHHSSSGCCHEETLSNGSFMSCSCSVTAEGVRAG